MEGTCKHCGQKRIFTEDECAGKTLDELNMLASAECNCGQGAAEKQVLNNMKFVEFVKSHALEFLEKHELKLVKVADTDGNKAELLRLESGDVKIVTSLKEIVA